MLFDVFWVFNILFMRNIHLRIERCCHLTAGQGLGLGLRVRSANCPDSFKAVWSGC